MLGLKWEDVDLDATTAIMSRQITREIYAHVTRPMQSDAADRVAAQTLRRRRLNQP